MEPAALRIGELICARVCHDLGGLAGTLTGTLQLAQEELAQNESAPGGGGIEALALAREAADALVRRLRLLRAALGPVSDPLGAPGIAELATGLGERLHVDVSGVRTEPLAAEQARLALAMLLLGAEALPMGGNLRLETNTEGMVVVTAHGPRAAWPPSIAQSFGQSLADAVPNAPRGLFAPFCGLLAGAAGMTLAAEDAPPRLCAVPTGRSQGLTLSS